MSEPIEMWANVYRDGAGVEAHSTREKAIAEAEKWEGIERTVHLVEADTESEAKTLALLFAAQRVLELSQPKWVKASERKPERLVRVIISHEGQFGIGWWDNGRWVYEGHAESALDPLVSHWMPLPAPPREGT